MDPNELLARMRELAQDINEGIVNHDPPQTVMRNAARLTEAFGELDAYLSAGHEFYPEAWQG